MFDWLTIVQNCTKRRLVTCKFFKISMLCNATMYCNVVLRLLAVSSKWWETCIKRTFVSYKILWKKKGRKRIPVVRGMTRLDCYSGQDWEDHETCQWR